MATQRLARLMAVAGGQHGVLTAGQASEAGISRDQVKRLVAGGLLERCDVGIIRIASWPTTWEQNLLIALLRTGPDAFVSHRAAARVWGIEGFERAPIELSAPRGSRRRPRLGIIHEVRDVNRRDLARRNGWWVTGPARTLVDLGGVVSEECLEVSVDDLLRRGLTTLEKIEETVERLSRPGREGPPAARALLSARRQLDGLTESGFETRLVRILRNASLPPPTLQHEIYDEGGRFVMRLDAAYAPELVGIEANSERWHTDRRRFVADRTKRAAAEALGWRILAFTHQHVVAEPEFVAHTVARTLAMARATVAHTLAPERGGQSPNGGPETKTTPRSG